MKKILCLAIALSGCGDSGTGNLSDPTGAYNALASELCKKYAACGVIGASEQSNCQQALLDSVNNGAYGLDEPFNQHRIILDGNQLQTCLNAVDAVGCSDFFDYAGSCQNIVVGQVAPGGTCKADDECTGGYCDRGTNSNQNGCPGTCKAFVATGSACTATTQCAPTDWCDTLKTKTCLARVPLMGMCTDLNACQQGLSCTGLGASPGTCTGASPTGAVCVNACASGNYCDHSAMPAVCKVQVANGVGCTQVASCVDGDVCIGAPNGVCGAWLDVGSTCDPTKMGVASGCPSDIPCDATSKTCKPPAAMVGTDCSMSSNVCTGSGLIVFGGLYCDETSKTCQKKVAFGAACVPNPNGSNPCIGGTCDPSSKVCALKCM